MTLAAVLRKVEVEVNEKFVQRGRAHETTLPGILTVDNCPHGRTNDIEGLGKMTA